MCQPGRPRPQGESQPGSSADDRFHSTKSAGLLLVRIDLDAGAGEIVLEIAARERAVVGHRADVEQHLADLRRLIGMAALDSAPISACMSAMLSVARGWTVGLRQPSAVTSAWYCAAVVSVTLRIASFSGRPGKSRAARALILSSTSVMLRT